MTTIIKISKRLTAIASFLPKAVYFADIGSDHAYLPCYVCLNDPHAKAVAGEVNQGPFEMALETVESFQLTNAIKVRLGDGLKVIKAEPITHVVIAGMGGPLIKSILNKGSEKLKFVDRIITQPNNDAKSIRKWFYENGFTITHETMIEENNHIYEVVVADKGNNPSSSIVNLTEKQLLFGPVLLEEKPKVFYKKWLSEKEKLQAIIHDIGQATVINTEKMEQFKNKVSLIKEVLLDEERNH